MGQAGLWYRRGCAGEAWRRAMLEIGAVAIVLRHWKARSEVILWTRRMVDQTDTRARLALRFECEAKRGAVIITSISHHLGTAIKE